MSTSAIEIHSEQIDDIPLLFTLLQKMRLQVIVDSIINPHGNRQGLSIGSMVVVWLAHILTEMSHCMDVVQEWVAGLPKTLAQLTGQEVRELDFSDDRLADILRHLSDDSHWHKIEGALGQHLLRVYPLPAHRLRLDGTTAAVYHNEQTHALFQMGKGKDGQYAVQFRGMLASLDPLGLTLAVDIVGGQRADDRLYVPCYRRAKEVLNRDGLLVVGDSKMSALATRAVMVAGADYYLTPLPHEKDGKGWLAGLLASLWAEKQATLPIFLPDEWPENGQAADEELAIAEGFVTSRMQTATVDGQKVVWTERCMLVRSHAYAATMVEGLRHRLTKAEAALNELTPLPGRGRQQIGDEATLKAEVKRIVRHYKVAGLLAISYDRQASSRHIRAYKDRAARVEETVRYQLQVQRNDEAIAQAERLLGWRIYLTNAPAENLSLTEAVLAYREQYLSESIFRRLKGKRLSITPLYVQRDDHALGLIRLLTLAARLLALTDYTVRQALAAEGEELAGIYAGNPKRSAARPTTERMLRAFQHITLTIVTMPGQVTQQVTPLTAVQERILALLGFSPAVYASLAAA